VVGVRAKDHDDKRQMILARTAELFAKQGFHGTSTAEISAACNASKSWIYHYFDSKEAILYELLTDFLDMYISRVDGATRAAKDPRDRLRAFMREALSLLIAYRINYAKLFGDIDALPVKQQRILRDRETEISKRLREILIELRPELKRDETRLSPITLLFLGSMVWSYTWFDPKGQISLDELVDLAISMLVDGLDGVTALLGKR
jgi:AcrR family transcriptional regulator